MTTASVSALGKRRARSGFLKWALPALGIAVIVAVHQTWDYVEGRRLGDMVSAIRSAGAPISMSDVTLHTPIEPRADDAAPYYTAAATLAPSRAMSAQGTSPNEMVLNERLRDKLVLSIDNDPAVLETIRPALAAKSEALRLLDLATVRRFVGFEPGSSYGYRQSQMLSLLSVCDLRTVYDAFAGDGNGAAASAAAELRMLSGPRFPIQLFVLGDGVWPDPHRAVSRVALLLNHSRPNADSLASLAVALRDADDDGQLVRMFEESRAGRLDIFANRYGSVFGNTRLFTSAPYSGAAWDALMRPMGTRDLLARLTVYDEAIQASRRAWPARLDEVGRLQMPAVSRLNPYGFFVEPFAKISVLFAGVLADVRATRVAVAIERYRQDHGGSLPDGLSALAPKLLEAVPIDPFSGTPLKYRRTDKGYVIYSVGPDRTDSAGAAGSDDVAVRIGG